MTARVLTTPVHLAADPISLNMSHQARAGAACGVSVFPRTFATPARFNAASVRLPQPVFLRTTVTRFLTVSESDRQTFGDDLVRQAEQASYVRLARREAVADRSAHIHHLLRATEPVKPPPMFPPYGDAGTGVDVLAAFHAMVNMSITSCLTSSACF